MRLRRPPGHEATINGWQHDDIHGSHRSARASPRATVARWLKKAGEAVAADEPLVELETDKVTVEVNAPSAGVLEAIAAPRAPRSTPGAVLGIDRRGGAAAAPKPRTAAASRRRPPPLPSPRAVPVARRRARRAVRRRPGAATARHCPPPPS